MNLAIQQSEALVRRQELDELSEHADARQCRIVQAVVLGNRLTDWHIDSPLELFAASNTFQLHDSSSLGISAEGRER